jgi:hypothetical protein
MSPGMPPGHSQSVAEWAKVNPKVRRAWIRGNRVALELQPVADSEETIAVSMANSARWQGQLRERLREPVELEFVDQDAAPGEGAGELVYERADPDPPA